MIILVIVCYLFASSSIVFCTIKNGISPMPTSSKVKRYLLALIQELEDKQGPIKIIYELGSGDGSLACGICQQMTYAKIVACENSPLPYILAIIRARLVRCQNLVLRWQNFDQLNITPAELIVCYLSTEIMANLSLKFQSELRAGTLIISHTFSLPEWKPEKIIYADDLYRTPIYLYRVPHANLI